MSILVIAEHDNQNLSPATFNTISASKKIGSDIDILVAVLDVQMSVNNPVKYLM